MLDLSNVSGELDVIFDGDGEDSNVTNRGTPKIDSICIAQRRKKRPIKIKKPLKVPGITSL